MKLTKPALSQYPPLVSGGPTATNEKMRDLIQSDSVYLLGVNVFRKVGKIRQKIQVSKFVFFFN